MAHSSNLILVLFIFLSSSTFTGFSQRGSEVTKMLPCMERMMPCQNYLNVENPPQSCCEPFIYILEHIPECLCAIFFNDDMLYYLNVSFVDAVNFPFKCNTTPLDTSSCTFMQVPTINVGGNLGPLITSHAGPSKYGIGFGRTLASAVVVLLVTKILFLVHVPDIF